MIRRQAKLFFVLIVPFILYYFFQSTGSDPTMDYSSLQGSGMSPQEYDSLVKQRQLQYAQENEDEGV
jgi:hypothetical protein